MRILLSFLKTTCTNEKIKIFTNLLKIFLEASQHKVVSVCILIIFDITVRYRGRFASKNLLEKWCPLFGVVRCLEVSTIGISITNDPDLK